MQNIKARMFMNSEYGFEHFYMIDSNYANVYIEQIVEHKSMKCFAYNSLCQQLENVFGKAFLQKEKIAFFEYVDGQYSFYTKNMENVTDKVPLSLLTNFLATKTKVYRYRFVRSENHVVIKHKDIKNKNAVGVINEEIVLKEEFLNKYGCLPKKDFSFEEITLEVE